ALAPQLLAAGKTRDENTWALLADTHIAADRAVVSRNVNMAAHLAKVARELTELPELPGGVFIAGDCAFSAGEKNDYATFTELLQPICRAEMSVHLALGNHDHRERFWEVLTKEKAIKPSVVDKQVGVIQSPRVNWYVLDSLETTLSTPGFLGSEQLDWLAKSLDENPGKPALILVHHNPGLLANIAGIKDTEELFKVIRPREQVKACIFGHTHNWSVTSDASGIHLINLPPVSYVFKAGNPNGWMKASVLETGMRLEMRCIDPAHKLHGHLTDLKWRSAV
ncbi:MAG: metallophosphoesterase, partial [Akkermansiaceae bacterium]|nr:metallophosphoesterase [Verrucomicrobiales bacterium]